MFNVFSVSNSIFFSGASPLIISTSLVFILIVTLLSFDGKKLMISALAGTEIGKKKIEIATIADLVFIFFCLSAFLRYFAGVIDKDLNMSNIDGAKVNLDKAPWFILDIRSSLSGGVVVLFQLLLSTVSNWKLLRIFFSLVISWVSVIGMLPSPHSAW
ncbi:TPA: hypothetical protein MNK97_005742 [Klebsiella pneumoniae]|nr:hypothetical protein [Klebsiella pneumoniae]